MVRTIIYYDKDNGDCPVESFLDSLDDKTKAKVFAAFNIIENQLMVPTKWFKKMSGTDDLWEVRVEWQSNIYRALGFLDKGRLVVLTNAFVKKGQKTPQNEINIATKYKRNYLERRKKK